MVGATSARSSRLQTHTKRLCPPLFVIFRRTCRPFDSTQAESTCRVDVRTRFVPGGGRRFDPISEQKHGSFVETLRAGETQFVRPVAVLRTGTPCLGLEETATVGMFLSTDVGRWCVTLKEM